MSVATLVVIAGLAVPGNRTPAIQWDDGRTAWLLGSRDGIAFPGEALSLEVRFHRGPRCESDAQLRVEQDGNVVAVVSDEARTPSVVGAYRHFPDLLASSPIRVDVPPAPGGRTTVRLTHGRCGASLAHAGRAVGPRLPAPVASPRDTINTRPLGTKALLDAARSGDAAGLERVLDSGTSPNAIDASADRQSALGLAAYRGHLDVVRILLERGAHVDAQDRRGYTPLMAAAQSGHIAIVRVLLERGADPNSATRSGETALLFAAMFADPDVVRALLDAGARRDTRNSLGDTAESLARALHRPDISAALAEEPSLAVGHAMFERAR